MFEVDVAKQGETRATVDQKHVVFARRMSKCQKYGMELLCFANPKSRTQIDRSRANSFFSFVWKDLEGLESEKGDRTQPSEFMVSALRSLSSYVLGPDMIALDVKSHSASDGESDRILRRDIACGLNVQVLAFPVWTYVCMNV